MHLLKLKHFSKIILTLWIICGLAASNLYSFNQSSGVKKSIKSFKSLQKSESHSNVFFSEYNEKHSETLIECENELKDDNEKLFAEALCFNYKLHEPATNHARYRSIECLKRSKSLHLLYCNFRI